MALNTDWKEFLSLFESFGVEFLVVGAWVRAYYGEPRMTGDIDFWVRPSPENAKRVVNAVAAFGFGPLGLTEDDFSAEDQVVQLGFPPRRIDLLTRLSGLTFEESWSRRVQGDLDGFTVFYLSRKDFIANKLTVGRPKDLADVEALEGEE